MVIANLFNVFYAPGTIQNEGLDLILRAMRAMSKEWHSPTSETLGLPVENVSRERCTSHISGENFLKQFCCQFWKFRPKK